MTDLPRGGRAVTEQRHTALDSLDDFPTPPWATRALCEVVIPPSLATRTIWEPAANRRIMADVLAEYAGPVWSTDVHDYGVQLDEVGSFVGEGIDIARWPARLVGHGPDWIITNPPFKLAEAFVARALDIVGPYGGVAMLTRFSWMEGVGRYTELFRPTPPSIVAVFVERVPMVKGRWDPAADTMTAYAWSVWLPGGDRTPPGGDARLRWIPPDQRIRLSKPDDVARFAVRHA